MAVVVFFDHEIMNKAKFHKLDFFMSQISFLYSSYFCSTFSMRVCRPWVRGWLWPCRQSTSCLREQSSVLRAATSFSSRQLCLSAVLMVSGSPARADSFMESSTDSSQASRLPRAWSSFTTWTKNEVDVWGGRMKMFSPMTYVVTKHCNVVILHKQHLQVQSLHKLKFWVGIVPSFMWSDFQPKLSSFTRRSHPEGTAISMNFPLTTLVPHNTSNIPSYKYNGAVCVYLKLSFTLKPSSPLVCRKTAFRWCLLCSSSHRASSWPRNSSILALPGCRARTSPRPSWGDSVKLMGSRWWRWWLTAICVGHCRDDVMRKVTKLSQTITLTLRPDRTRCPVQQRALVQYCSMSEEKWRWLTLFTTSILALLVRISCSRACWHLWAASKPSKLATEHTCVAMDTLSFSQDRVWKDKAARIGKRFAFFLKVAGYILVRIAIGKIVTEIYIYICQSNLNTSTTS